MVIVVELCPCDIFDMYHVYTWLNHAPVVFFGIWGETEVLSFETVWKTGGLGIYDIGHELYVASYFRVM